MATLRERLDAHEGQPEQKWAVRKNVSVGERGQNFLAMFSPERLSAVYAVDGGIINDKKTQTSKNHRTRHPTQYGSLHHGDC